MNQESNRILDRCLFGMGRQIVSFRTKSGIDQAQLAFEADIGLRTLRRIEKSTANPTLQTVIAIADALNVHPAALWNFVLEPDFAQASVPEPCPLGTRHSCVLSADGEGASVPSASSVKGNGAHAAFTIDPTQFIDIAELMPDAIALFDNKGRVCFSNKPFCELFGYSADELLGMVVESLMPPKYRASHKKKKEEYLRHPHPRGMGNVCCEGVTKNGETVALDVLLQPIEDDVNLSILCVARRLSRAVEKQRALEARIKKLELLFYKTGHDLKAPVDSLTALSLMLRNESDAGKRSELMDMMEKSLRRMMHSVVHLVEFNSILKKSLRMMTFRLKPYLADLIEYTVLPESRSQVVLDCPDIAIKSDPDILFTILQNLLHNAVKYSDARNRSIEIKAHSSVKSIQFSIADNGRGIKKKELAHIFDLFYQTHEGQDGKGFGLYAARDAASQLGGSITVFSEYGKGSTFKLSLPKA